ncbi:MAG TPA: HD domain-containing protein, partial [Chloroflexota bacterium]|nr:HD domain-containing protein [Chloroflexota bacterium]
MTKVTLISLEELLELLPNGEAARQVRQAYAFAEKIHHGRRRASGELYIDHDIAVAQILVQLESDVPTVIAGLLHDCLLPHTQIDLPTVKNQFGAEVTNLIKGLQNLYNYAAEAQYQKYQETESATLEEIRRAILTIIEVDIRVILIRMADCLQDLRKASHLPAEERHKVALEAMNVFAPLA